MPKNPIHILKEWYLHKINSLRLTEPITFPLIKKEFLDWKIYFPFLVVVLGFLFAASSHNFINSYHHFIIQPIHNLLLIICCAYFLPRVGSLKKGQVETPLRLYIIYLMTLLYAVLAFLIIG